MRDCAHDVASRRSFLTLLGASLAVAGMGRAGDALAAESGFAAIPKSLWVWRTPLSESTEVASIVRQYNFHTVFYSIPPAERQALFAGDSKEASVIRAFRDSGVRFYAVAGDAVWTHRPQQVPRAVEDLINFQARTRLLDGLCLDIEPHTLPEWKAGGAAQEEEPGVAPQRSEPFEEFGARHPRLAAGRGPQRVPLTAASDTREEIIRNYLELLGTISHAAASDSITLAAAVVPFFANQEAPGGGSMLEAAASHVQEIIMMGYRNTPQAALNVSRKSLQQLDAESKPWWFGVSTFQHPKSPDITYVGSTFEQFSTAMVDLDQSLSSGNRGFYRGIAINDYPSLTAILRA